MPLLLTSVAADAKPPNDMTVIRDQQYVCVMGKKGDLLTFRLNCRKHSDRPTGVTFTVIEPDSEVLREGLVPLLEKREFTCTLRRDGMHIIALECVGNTYDIAVDKLPFAYLASKRHKFHLCAHCKPLHFVVPGGKKRLSLFVRAGTTKEGALIRIRGPQGEVVHEEQGDYDRETRIQVDVPSGTDGHTWSVVFTRPTEDDLRLDDVVLHFDSEIRPFATPRKEWAELFAKE